MLRSRTIPQYEGNPADWHGFLYKASIGSYKAHEILANAEMRFMIDLMDDPKAPEVPCEDKYQESLRGAFPPAPPSSSVHALIDLGCDQNWFPHRFNGTESPRNESVEYRGLWKRSRAVEWSALVNDALLLCLEVWSPDHCLACMDEDLCDYDARVLVAGMLYLAFTWPEA